MESLSWCILGLIALMGAALIFLSVAAPIGFVASLFGLLLQRALRQRIPTTRQWILYAVAIVSTLILVSILAYSWMLYQWVVATVGAM